MDTTSQGTVPSNYLKTRNRHQRRYHTNAHASCNTAGWFLAFLPNREEKASTFPRWENTMNGAVITQVIGQLVPRAATPHAVDDAIEHLRVIAAVAPGVLERVQFQNSGLDLFPQIVWRIPEYILRFPLLCPNHLPRHGSSLVPNHSPFNVLR